MWGNAASVVIAVCLATFSNRSHADEFKNLFTEKKATVLPKRGETATAAEQQAEQALRTLAKLTFISENDSRQYSRNIQAILGYYARINDQKQLELLGGSQKLSEQKVDLKDAIIFKGVVKSGFNAGLNIPILQFNVKNSEVYEIGIQDVVTIAARFDADEIACNFPFSHAKEAKPQGSIQYYYIPAVTVSSMTTKKFSSSDGGLKGVFSILNIGADKYFSAEATETKYFVTVSLSPVSPLDIATCKLVAERTKPKPAHTVAALFEQTEEPSSLEEPKSAGQEEPLTAGLKGRINEPALQGAVFSVKSAPWLN